jgi:hypothetical protein
MKKLLIILLVTVTALSASAQRAHPGGHYNARPRVVVRAGVYAPLYPSYYGYYGGYSYYPPYYGYAQRPTKLDLKIEDIKNDCEDKIWSVKHNESLSRKEKRRTVHQLRYERDQAIIQAKKDYYKPRR